MPTAPPVPCAAGAALPDASEHCASSTISASSPPSPLVLQSQQGPAGRWEVGGGAAGTGIEERMGAGAPCQDQWAASQPSLGLSSEAAAERSRQGSVLGDSDGGSEWGTVPRAHQGCNAQVLCCGSPSGYSAQERCRGSFVRGPHWGTMLGTGAAVVPQRHISALLTSTAPPKCSCPEPSLSWGANSPSWLWGTLAHISPLLQSSLPLQRGWGHSPWQPWHTQPVSDGAEQHFVLSHLSAAP